jgi:dihydrofolate synthase/folylpolyglutamate synthase
MTYPDSVRFLYALGNEIKTAKFGLDRITAVLEELDNPHRACRFVHVAGTNGKGSTCALIESVLRAAGQRTGLYTSPHLIEPTERIQISGQPVSAAQFTSAFDRVHQAAERLLDRGVIDLHPTYFETVTAMAFVLFQEEQVETVVLEVGLGGRLDATNVVTPQLCVITPVDFDHEAWLGKSLQSIAHEKAGILKARVPAVVASQHPEAQLEIERRAREVGAPLTKVPEAWRMEELVCEARGSRFQAFGGKTPRRIHVVCPLAGRHQAANALVAVAALDLLGTPDRAIEQGIAAAHWPGRIEHVAESPEMILDGAHNPAGAAALAAYLDEFYKDRRITLIYGAMRDKAVAEVAGILFPRAYEVIVTAPRQSRAAVPETVRDLVDHPRVRIAPDIAAALEQARGTPRDGVVLITGSLYLVGEAKALR